MRMHVVTITTLLSLACAHGSHSHEESVDPAENWALYHMQEEHRKDCFADTLHHFDLFFSSHRLILR